MPPPFPRLRALLPLLLIALLLLLPPTFALAQEGLYAPVAAPTVATAATATLPNTLSLDTATYMLGLGPLGALLYGAYLIGKGVKVTIQVELSPEDRRIFEELISVLRPKTRGGAP